MDYQQFYPTPATLGERLANLIKHIEPPILEPSAGTGDLCKAIINTRKYNRRDPRYSAKDFHCVELNADRAAILKGNEFKVIWDNFLTFNPLMPYQTIIMNPPFHEGAKHLQKALNILADGGEIACILNAETIRNPYTNERKTLTRQLEEQEDYQVEFVKSAFDGTNVEVALIHVKKKAATVRSATFEHFKKSIVTEREQTAQQALIRHSELDALVDLYQAEVKTALALYNEIQNYNTLTGKDSTERIFDIKLNSHGAGHAGIVKAINYKYWFRLLHSKELDRLLTTDAQYSYSTKLREMEEYEFNERNILQLKADLVTNLFENVDAAIMKVWDNFTHRFSWNDYSQNIHYYNGWKTNKAFKCNRKVIIPLYAFDNWCGNYSLDISKIRGELSDIEKAMNYLDCGRAEGSDMIECLIEANEMGLTRNIVTKFFTVALYKKGTCHLTFNDETLLKKFNLYCGKKLNWLPDDYGRKPYESLNHEERAVADSFEGRESYNETYHNQQFYLPTDSNLLMLTAATSIAR